MQFSNAEVAFLFRGGNNNRGNQGRASLSPRDFEGYPTQMQTFLESRAKTLGPEFAEFRAEQARLANPNAPFTPDSLDQRVQGSKLF